MGFLDQVKTLKAVAPDSRTTRSVSRATTPAIKVLKGGILSVNGKVLDDMGFEDGDYIAVKSAAGNKAGRSTVKVSVAVAPDTGKVLIARYIPEHDDAVKSGAVKVLQMGVTSGSRNNAQLSSLRLILQANGLWDSTNDDQAELSRAQFSIEDDGTLVLKGKGKGKE